LLKTARISRAKILRECLKWLLGCDLAIPMGIFDVKHLQVRANNLVALTRDQDQKGQLGFAEQLRAQARKYFKELAVMGDRSDDDSHRDEKSS